LKCHKRANTSKNYINKRDNVRPLFIRNTKEYDIPKSNYLETWNKYLLTNWWSVWNFPILPNLLISEGVGRLFIRFFRILFYFFYFTVRYTFSLFIKKYIFIKHYTINMSLAKNKINWVGSYFRYDSDKNMYL